MFKTRKSNFEYNSVMLLSTSYVMLFSAYSDHNAVFKLLKKGKRLQYVIYGQQDVTDHVWLNCKLCV